jgi:hypothetical protein
MLTKHYEELDKFYQKYGEKFVKKGRPSTTNMRINSDLEINNKKEQLQKSLEMNNSLGSIRLTREMYNK